MQYDVLSYTIMSHLGKKMYNHVIVYISNNIAIWYIVEKYFLSLTQKLLQFQKEDAASVCLSNSIWLMMTIFHFW